MTDDKAVVEAIFREMKAWLEPEFEKMVARIDANKRSLAERIEKLEQARPAIDAGIERQARDFERRAQEIGAEQKALAERVTTLEFAEPVIESLFSKWALDFEHRARGILEREVDRLPKAKDGADGMSPDDLQIELHERTLTVKFLKGDRIISRNVSLPIPIFRGIHRPKEAYGKGDLVVHSGSMWIAKEPNRSSPPGSDWQLVVRRGKDGRDAA